MPVPDRPQDLPSAGSCSPRPLLAGSPLEKSKCSGELPSTWDVCPRCQCVLQLALEASLSPSSSLLPVVWTYLSRRAK
mgnify:CR=1 FL=1